MLFDLWAAFKRLFVLVIRSPSFTRKLSLADLTYAASGYRKEHPNQVVCQLVVKGSGITPAKDLQNAVERVVEYCPMLRARLTGFWGIKYWSASGALPRIRTVNQEWNGVDQLGIDFFSSPLDLMQGPVAEIVQVVGTTHTYLIFRVHHAVADGMGLLTFAESIFQLLRKQEPARYFSKITLEKMPPGNLKAIPPRIQNASAPYPLQSQAQRKTDRSQVWKRISIPKKDHKILLKTILAMADLARGNTHDTIRIHMPVSLRRHAPSEHTLANLIGMVRIDVAPDDNCQSLVRKIKQHMHEQQELPIAVNSITSKLIFWIPLRLLHWSEKAAISHFLSRPKFRCSGTSSFLGHKNLADLSSHHFIAENVFCIPPSPLGTPLLAVLITNEASSEIVISANSTLASTTEMDRIAKKMHSLLINCTPQAIPAKAVNGHEAKPSGSAFSET